MRSAPIFQPALNSSRSVPESHACEDGLTFAAHYPADKYAASLAQGAARLELWTDVPVSQSDAASTSKATSWKAVPLNPVNATLGHQSGYSFVAKVKCSDEAVDGVFGFTYRIVHPDGQIDWLGSPSNDGQIYVPSLHNPALTIRQLVHAHQGTDLAVLDTRISVHEQDETITLGTLAASRRETSGCISFSIKASDVQSGLVVERTKSTWCTSRRFQSLADVSSDFGANLIVLELAQSSRREVLVLMPVFDDTHATSLLVRGSCSGGSVSFELKGSNNTQAKVSIALGTVEKLEQTIAACRAHAERSLRTCSHEPLGLGWSAKKVLDLESPQSPGVEDVIPSLAYSYTEPDSVDISFYSDSTAVEGSNQGLSTSSSMIMPIHEQQLHPQNSHDDDDDRSTVNGDRTVQADIRSSPLQPKAGLGFCTWEAMQNENRRPMLSEVVNALEAAEERLGKGSITALLIDDGWQDVIHAPDHRGRLNDFDMDPSVLDLDAAESGDHGASVLSRYISHIRQRFPSIKSVGCWMTLAGYWDGIHPDGPIAKGLSAPLCQVHVEDSFRQASRDWYIQATELDMHLFWDRAFHSLRQGGVDFVKIDAQAEWEWIQDIASDRTMTHASALGKAAFEAMEGAATRYFGAGGVVHSMGFTSALTNTSRTLHSQGMTIRCTDDFFPQIPDAHRHHLVHNVYNSMLLPEHRCDADMLSHCSDSLSSGGDAKQDYTGYHASFRAFTDARLWFSDKADAPKHASLRALAAPEQLSEQGAKIGVQLRGSLLPDATFDDLIGEGSGPALKLVVQHEKIGSATLGLWNLRGSQANSFDLVDMSQILAQPGHCAVKSFRTGKIWLLSNDTSHGSTLSTVLKEGSWEVLALSPLLSTSVEGVHVAMLGSKEHFMTPNGIHSITISTSNPAKVARRRRSASKSHRPSHHRRRSSRSSTYSFSSAASATETELTTTRNNVDTLVQQTNGSQAVLLSLALINGLFAMLHGLVRSPQRTSARTKKAQRADVLDTVISMLDKIQTLMVFGLLIVASWTSIIPVPNAKDGKTWLPAWGKKQISDSNVDDQTLKRVRLRPADAVATLKKCLTARTISPLRKFPISIAEPQAPTTTSSPEIQVKPRLASPEPVVTSKSDVVFTSVIDMAAKIGFLVICPAQACIKTCIIDRTVYDCALTPWITVTPIEIEVGSASLQAKEDGGAFKLEVDMKAWLASQDETYVQSLSAPVSVSIRISASV
ncbi:hypothetical protein NDA16_001210 [Ustilago loliicola]|nr:hypothetical protein NDA16_001210 [Ustilago loliicola]